MAKHIKSVAKIPEVAHVLAAIHVPGKDQQITSRSLSDRPTVDSLISDVRVSTNADEITLEITKAVFSFLNIILVVLVGSRDGQL